jgi:hypothetical protein
MSFLGSLPLELREDIYEHVLIAPLASAPPDVDVADELLIGRETFCGFSWETQGLRDIKYTKPPSPACVALLLLSRQIHNEVKTVLRRMEGKIDYDIDIIVADQAELLPTWTRIPVLSSRVRSVKATFRIAGDYHLKESRLRRTSRGFHAGTPPYINWAFYNILHRLLLIGPVGKYIGPGQAYWNGSGQDLRKDRQVILDHLEMEVLTPPHIDPKRLRPARSRRRFDESKPGMQKPTVKDVLSPGFLADFIRDRTEFLLSMGTHALGYGDILYERIGSIRLLQDGVEKRHWELGNCLSELTFDKPGSSKEPLFAEFMARIPEVRKENGLSVAPNLATSKESLSTDNR